MKLKTFEKFGVFNLKDIINSDNLSAEYHLNKREGRNPFIKEDGIYVPLKTKTIPKTAEYLTAEQVEEYNKLAEQIKELQVQQEMIKSQQRTILSND